MSGQRDVADRGGAVSVQDEAERGSGAKSHQVARPVDRLAASRQRPQERQDRMSHARHVLGQLRQNQVGQTLYSRTHGWKLGGDLKWGAWLLLRPHLPSPLSPFFLLDACNMPIQLHYTVYPAISLRAIVTRDDAYDAMLGLHHNAEL